MTAPEHRLIVEMFKQQALLYAGLVELLKSRGLVIGDDLEAFDELVSASSRAALELNVEAEYQANAKVLGVTTGLPRVAEL